MSSGEHGVKAKHAIITDECREGRGDEGAFDEAVSRLRDAYDWRLDKLADDVEGVRFHLKLEVEYPPMVDDE